MQVCSRTYMANAICLHCWFGKTKTPVDLIIWQIYVMNGHPEQLWPAAKSANYSILKCTVIMWLCSLPLWGPSLYLRLAVMIPLILYLRLAIRAAVYEWNGGKPEGDGVKVSRKLFAVLVLQFAEDRRWSRLCLP